MATKAKLTVILKADETVVAESDDAALWQSVLSSIHGGKLPELSGAASQESKGPDGIGDVAINGFAKRIGVSADIVIGSLSPSLKAPYLELDQHCWAAMKKNTPQRGPGSMSATGLAATLLALWLKEAKLEVQTTLALAGDVLKTIDVKDPNPGRGVKNTKWLQCKSGGVVFINPAEIAKALEVLRAFCTKEWNRLT